MTRSPILVSVLLTSFFCFGSTITEEQLAREVLSAFRLHPGMPNPDSLQVFNVVSTSEGVCMEYQVTTAAGGMRTGKAVYKTDKDLVYIDNSWIWDASCLSGKYGQRREGKELTERLSAALEIRKKQPVRTSPQKTASVGYVQVVATPIRRVVSPKVEVPSPATAAPETAAARLVVTAPASTVAPAPAEIAVPTAHVTSIQPPPAELPAAPRLQVATPASVIVATPASSATPIAITPSPAKTVASASATPSNPASQSGPVVVTPAARPAPVVVPVAPPPTVVTAPASVASQIVVTPVETGTVRGVTILDANGALGNPTPSAPGATIQESLADAARRLKKAKQQ